MTLAWGDKEDGPQLLSLYADEEHLGSAPARDFFEGWDAEALRWLIGELGITPAMVRTTLGHSLPEW